MRRKGRKNGQGDGETGASGENSSFREMEFDEFDNPMRASFKSPTETGRATPTFEMEDSQVRSHGRSTRCLS